MTNAGRSSQVKGKHVKTAIHQLATRLRVQPYAHTQHVGSTDNLKLLSKPMILSNKSNERRQLSVAIDLHVLSLYSTKFLFCYLSLAYVLLPFTCTYIWCCLCICDLNSLLALDTQSFSLVTDNYIFPICNCVHICFAKQSFYVSNVHDLPSLWHFLLLISVKQCEQQTTGAKKLITNLCSLFAMSTAVSVVERNANINNLSAKRCILPERFYFCYQLWILCLQITHTHIHVQLCQPIICYDESLDLISLCNVLI